MILSQVVNEGSSQVVPYSGLVGPISSFDWSLIIPLEFIVGCTTNGISFGADLRNSSCHKINCDAQVYVKMKFYYSPVVVNTSQNRYSRLARLRNTVRGNNTIWVCTVSISKDCL